MPKNSYKYKFKISIILCTYQGMSSLYHSLSNVLLQNMPQKDYEVISISHGVKDAIGGDLFNYVSNSKRIFVPIDGEKPYQPCFVRNQGINQVEGKLVLFLHDNVDLVGTDWLKRLWKYSEFGEKGVYTRKIVYKYNKDGSIGRDDDIEGFYAQQDAVPAKYLKIVGGFDEAYDGDAGMDDFDLELRCRQQGCEFIYPGKYELFSIKHNLRDLYPSQKTITNWDGSRNRDIFANKGFVH